MKAKTFFLIAILAGIGIIGFGVWITVAIAMSSVIGGMQNFGANVLPGVLLLAFGVFLATAGAFKIGKASE